MTFGADEPSPRRTAGIAGGLYLLIVVLGISAEILVRSKLFVEGDAAATAARIAAEPNRFFWAFAADSVMFLCDVAVAGLLFVLLRPVSHTGALVAMLFRLVQTAVLAVNLLNYHAAWLLLTGDYAGPQARQGAYFFLDLHRHGYDLGLLAFGVHCLVLGTLIYRSGYLPKILGALAVAAGAVYLIGSYTRFLAPEYLSAITPIYGVALVSELSLSLWLLFKGVNPDGWRRRLTPEGAI